MEFKDVEQARAKYQSKLNKGWTIAGVIIGVFVIVGLFPGLWGDGSVGFVLMMAIFVMVVLVVATGIIYGAAGKDAEKYRKAYKAYFVGNALAEGFKDYSYDHAKGIPKALLARTGMINTGDRYSSNDLVVGKYKDVKLMQADACIDDEHTDSDGHTYYTNMFKGRFMIYEFPKKFNFRMEVVGKRFTAYAIPNRKFQKVKLESPEFNRRFRVWGEDGFEVFYLLDPAIIEQVQLLGEKYKDRVFLGFLNNTLVVGIDDGKDAMEPPRAKGPLNEKIEMARVKEDIKMVTDLVDKLKLDRKIFEK